MATRPAEPTTLGKFVAYPSDATGTVAPYWLASSPGAGGQRVRMTGACKRAFIATIEAVIERAMAPASCGSYPAANTDFLSIALNGQGLHSLVGLGKWAAVADRAGLGARLKRGCPREDWNLLVSLVSALWSTAAANLDAGTVYAWQTSMLDFETNGWVDGPISVYASCQDLAFSVADDAYAVGDPIALRLWGDFPGGTGGYPVVDWVSDALRDIGASVMDPSMTPGGYADGELNGTPAPLQVGHEGNWFGSTQGAMVGQTISARRSSSAWAVLQSMLANMRFTHLLFPYTYSFTVTVVEREIIRHVTMDPDTGDIVVVEVQDTETTTSGGTSSTVFCSADQNLQVGLAMRVVSFTCAAADQEALAVFVRPADGWATLGQNLVPYLNFGAITDGGGTVALTRYMATGINSVAVDTEPIYPSAGMQQYVAQYGNVTFCDCYEYYSSIGMSPDWAKYSVRAESGNADLRVPVRSHAQWLLGQLPSIPFPTVDAPVSAATLASLTSQFWAAWQVYYPDQPNITVNGQPAYFPVAFRNPTFDDHIIGEITYNSGTGEWTSPAREVIFGTYHLAFPNLDSIQFGPQTYQFTNNGTAMAAHKWSFKAMPAA